LSKLMTFVPRPSVCFGDLPFDMRQNAEGRGPFTGSCLCQWRMELQPGHPIQRFLSPDAFVRAPPETGLLMKPTKRKAMNRTFCVSHPGLRGHYWPRRKQTGASEMDYPLTTLLVVPLALLLTTSMEEGRHEAHVVYASSVLVEEGGRWYSERDWASAQRLLHYRIVDRELPESRRELRPRLCNIKKGASGYGFNLHSEKSKPGQYIRAVDDDSPAQKSGLRPQDRIVQVNGTSVEGKQHSEVVAAIKAGGDETGLLVVDAETDAFFRKCGVLPAEKHLTGPLPEPVLNGEPEQTANGKVVQEAEVKASVSPAPSSASSSASLPEVRRSTPPPETKAEKEPVEDAGLALTMSLQQAKERAHQKRSNKRAPPMDWSKRNELFSNL
ncbi:Na(+)/H(+) exchange regulatory cofactor NHE-RF1-like, partial [Scleropages formosus]